MLPFASIPPAIARAVRFVLFDIDDTITEAGLLLPDAYDAMWKLYRAGFGLVPVTGRPAGWCDLIARQWPVAGVIGENGAFAFYMHEGSLQRLYHPVAPEPGGNKLRLEALAKAAIAQFPGLRLAKDQAYRLFDVALDFAEEQPDLGLDLARKARDYCVSAGAVAKISSIHVNAWFGAYDKLSMAEYFLQQRYAYVPQTDEATVLYFGDSPNDEPMFGRFSLSCGVANVRQYCDLMHNHPKFVTERPFGYGFAEAVAVLLGLVANH
jgi:hypothetical protein